MATGCSVSKLRAAQIDLISWLEDQLAKKDDENFIWTLLKTLLGGPLLALVQMVEDLINGLLGIFGLSDILPPFPTYDSDALTSVNECTKTKTTESSAKLTEMQEKADAIANAELEEDAYDERLEQVGRGTTWTWTVATAAKNAGKVLNASVQNSLAEIEDAFEAFLRAKETIDGIGWGMFKDCKNPMDKLNALVGVASNIYEVLMTVAKQALQSAATTLTAILNPVADVINSIFAFINTLLDNLLHSMGLQKSVGSDLTNNVEADHQIFTHNTAQAQDAVLSITR